MFAQGRVPAAPSVGELTSLRTFHLGSVRCCLKNKERKKKKKAVQGHFLRRLGQVRQPQGTDRGRSPGPCPGRCWWEPRALQPGLCLHRNWVGQWKPLETLGSVKNVSGSSFPHTLCILLHPYFKNIQIHSTEYTRMCSRCLKIPLASGKWG